MCLQLQLYFHIPFYSMPKIPNAILEDLKCRHCKRWISCGPVYVVPDGSSLCGRCECIAIKQYRHIAFEALACHFQYPCQYYPRHCPELLPWNLSLEHEEDCTYQSFCGTLCSHPSVICKKEKKLDVSEGKKKTNAFNKPAVTT